MLGDYFYAFPCSHRAEAGILPCNAVNLFIQLLWKFPEVQRSKIVVMESTIISCSVPVQSIAHLHFFL